ncbi:hypothetical protein, partial [Streptomyces violaceus]
MTAPTAFTVHDGHGRPPKWRRQLIAAWLTANDVNPDNVSADHAITVLTVPFRPEETADGGPWMLQVIVLHQYHVNANGSKEQNLITRKPVTFQRTVPLKVAFPPEPATVDEGSRHGQAESEAAEEAPEEVVRHPEQAQVSDPRQGARQKCAGQGQTVRNESAAEEGPCSGDEAIPEPEEDRR